MMTEVSVRYYYWTVLKLSIVTQVLNVTCNIAQYVLHSVCSRLSVVNVVVMCFHPLIRNSSTPIHHNIIFVVVI